MQKRQNKHPDPTPWLFLAPSLCGVTLFVLAPFVETVRRSVTDTMGRHFVGLANYTAVLGNDAFRLAVENTVRFIGVCFAGGKPCTALESIVCPKRPCERNFWHPL